MAADNYATRYTVNEWERAGVDALDGLTLLEFGTGWCPVCQRAQPLIQAVVGAHPEIRHLKIEDGPGRRLGRSFRIKLWPTLIVLREGSEVGRVVRPYSAAEVEELLSRVGATP